MELNQQIRAVNFAHSELERQLIRFKADHPTMGVKEKEVVTTLETTLKGLEAASLSLWELHQVRVHLSALITLGGE